MHARVVTPAWAIAENNKVYHDTNLGSWLLKSGVWTQSHMQEEKKLAISQSMREARR